MNKILSSLAAIALLAVTIIGPVQAAAINQATAVLDGTLLVGQTITITKATVFTDANEIVSATIKKLDGTAAGITTLTAVGANAVDTTSQVTIATSDLVNNTSYFIYFRTANNDFGVAQLNAGTPTTETVSVTAVVEPTLTFTVGTTGSVNLGTLVAGTTSWSTGTTDLSVATNASSGYVISAATDVSGATGFAATAGAATDMTAAAGDGKFAYYVSAENSAAGSPVVAYSATTSAGSNATTDAINSGSGSPESAIWNVKYGARSTALTPAGNKTFVITYTLTPSF